MKKILLLAVMLISCASFAQLKVVDNTDNSETIGKIAPMGSMSATITKSDNIYILAYKNVKYQTIEKAESFSMNEKEFEDLYNFIISKFKAKKRELVSLELENAYLDLDFTKTMGIVSLKIYQHQAKGSDIIIGESPFFTKKQIQKLFGKR